MVTFLHLQEEHFIPKLEFWSVCLVVFYVSSLLNARGYGMDDEEKFANTICMQVTLFISKEK